MLWWWGHVDIKCSSNIYIPHLFNVVSVSLFTFGSNERERPDSLFLQYKSQTAFVGPFVIISSPLPPCHLSVGPTPDSAPVLMFTAKWPGCWLLFSFVCFTQRPFNQGRSVEDLAPITATTWEAWPRPRSVKSEQLLFLFCPFLRISSHSRRHSSSCIK